MVFSFVLILIGLALVSMCLNLVQLKLNHLVEELTELIEEKQAVDEEEEEIDDTADASDVEQESGDGRGRSRRRRRRRRRHEEDPTSQSAAPTAQSGDGLAEDETDLVGETTQNENEKIEGDEESEAERRPRRRGRRGGRRRVSLDLPGQHAAGSIRGRGARATATQPDATVPRRPRPYSSPAPLARTAGAHRAISDVGAVVASRITIKKNPGIEATA